MDSPRRDQRRDGGRLGGGPLELEPQAHRRGRRRQVPAAVPLLHQAQRLVHRYRGLQHLHPDPRRGRPHRHPGPTARASGWSAAPPPSTPATTPPPPTPRRQGRAHLLAQRRQGRRPVRGFLRRVLGRRGQRQERVRHQRPRYLPAVNYPSPAASHDGTEALDGSISQGFGAAGGTKRRPAQLLR